MIVTRQSLNFELALTAADGREILNELENRMHSMGSRKVVRSVQSSSEMFVYCRIDSTQTRVYFKDSCSAKQQSK